MVKTMDDKVKVGAILDHLKTHKLNECAPCVLSRAIFRFASSRSIVMSAPSRDPDCIRQQ